MMRNSYIMNIVLYLYTVGNDYSSLLVSGFMSQEKRGLILTISDLSANMPMKKQADLSYRLFFFPFGQLIYCQAFKQSKILVPSGITNFPLNHSTFPPFVDWQV